MIVNKFGQTTLSENEFFNILYSKKNVDIDNLYLNDPNKIDQFNRSNKTNYTDLPNLKNLIELNISLEEFDKTNQQQWFIPDHYKSLDIEKFIFEKCQAENEKERVLVELELFKKHNLIEVLKYLKFLVDTMKKYNVLWGVGRGSSVASYCLYILEVHRVDSIKYNLDINEFLK